MFFLGIGVTCALSILVTFLPKLWIKNYEKTESWMISSTMIWLCFLLLESYYGGALTMFFTSGVTIPLETLSDVLEAYPGWRLKILDGLQIYFLGSNVPKVLKKLELCWRKKWI